VSRARKVRKRFKLVVQQVRILDAQYRADEESFRNGPFPMTRGEFIFACMDGMPPLEDIRQARHERRVFGHDVIGCQDCTPEGVGNMIAWNQPANLWMGRRIHLTGDDVRTELGYDGHAYRRRILNRRKKK
jgi:hypothetical protein